jgi:hypothetical protein
VPSVDHRFREQTAVRRPRIGYLFGSIGSNATSLVIGASIDTGGVETSYHVEYGPGSGYGSRTPEATLPARPQPESGYPTTGELRVAVANLKPGIRYSYRLVAVNAAGSTASPRRTIVSGGKSPRISDAYVRKARRSTSIVVGATVDTGGLPTFVRIQCSPGNEPMSPVAQLPATPSPTSWAPTKREVRFLLTGLAVGKNYPCRIIASNDVGSTAYERDFVAGKRPHGIQFPAIIPGPTATSVVVSAMIDTGGLRTTYFVEHGSGLSYGQRTGTKVLRPTPGTGWSPTTTEVRIPLRGLDPGSTHYFRIRAVNTDGTDSVARSFVSDGKRPTISYQFVRPGGGYNSALFTAAIDTGGLATTYYFEYGPTLDYGERTATRALSAVPARDSYRPTVTETGSEELVLTRGATFHYRVVAVNAAGRTNSSDRTFTLN